MSAYLKKICKKLFHRNGDKIDNGESTKNNEELTKGNEELTKGNKELTKGNEELTKSNEELAKGNELTKNHNESIQTNSLATMSSYDQTNTLAIQQNVNFGSKSINAEFSDESEPPIHELTENVKNFMNEEVESRPSTTAGSAIPNIFSSLDQLKQLNSDWFAGTENNNTLQDGRKNTSYFRIPKIKIINQSTVVNVDDTSTDETGSSIKRVKLSKNMIRTSQVKTSRVLNHGRHLTASEAQSKYLPCTTTEQVREMLSSSRNLTFDCMLCEESFDNKHDLNLHLHNHYYSSTSTPLESPPPSSSYSQSQNHGSQSTASKNLSVAETWVQNQTYGRQSTTSKAQSNHSQTRVQNHGLQSIASEMSQKLPSETDGASTTDNIKTSVSHASQSQTLSLHGNGMPTTNNSDTSPTTENLAKTPVRLQKEAPNTELPSDTELPHEDESYVFLEEIETEAPGLNTQNGVILPLIDGERFSDRENFETEVTDKLKGMSMWQEKNWSNMTKKNTKMTEATISRSQNTRKSKKKAAYDHGRDVSHIVMGNILTRKINKSDNSIKAVKLSKNMIRTTQIKKNSDELDKEHNRRMSTSLMDPALYCMLCGESLENKYDLKVHLQNHYNSCTSAAQETPPTSNSCTPSHNQGRQSTASKARSTNHPGTATNQTWNCLVCLKTFTSNAQFLAHIQTHANSNSNLESPFLVRATPKELVVTIMQKTYERINGERREITTITENRVPIVIVPSEGQEPTSDRILSFSVASEVPMKQALNQAKRQAVLEKTAPHTVRETASNKVRVTASNKGKDTASNKARETTTNKSRETTSNKARKDSLPSLSSDSVGPSTHTNSPISQSFADDITAQLIPVNKNAYPSRRSPRISYNPYSSFWMEDFTSKSSFGRNNRNCDIEVSSSATHSFDRKEGNKISKRSTTSSSTILTIGRPVNRNCGISEISTPSTSLSPTSKKRKNNEVHTTSRRINISYGDFPTITSSNAVPSTSRRDINYEDSNRITSNADIPSTPRKVKFHFGDSNTIASNAVIPSTRKEGDTSKYPNSSSRPYHNPYTNIPPPKRVRLHRNLVLPQQGRYRCIKCGKSYNTMDDFNAHSMLHPEEYTKCDSCETRFKGRVRPEWYRGYKLCSICSSMPRSLRPKPKKQNEKRINFVCDICRKKFVKFHEFKRHRNEHLK